MEIDEIIDKDEEVELSYPISNSNDFIEDPAMILDSDHEDSQQITDEFITKMMNIQLNQFAILSPNHRSLSISKLTSLLLKIKEGTLSSLSLIHQKYIFDWAKESIDFSLESHDIQWAVNHFWDFIAIEGKPFTPISPQDNTIFPSITFTLSQWSRPYGNTRYNSDKNSFQYTIYLGSSNQIQWYFVFKILSSEYEHSSTLPLHRFTEIVDFIIELFETVPELYKYGLNSHSFDFNKTKKWRIDLSTWKIFQQEFFRQWEKYFQLNGTWSYWRYIIPSIHMFDCGSNISIMLSEEDDQVKDISYITRSLAQLFDPREIHAISFALASEIGATYRPSLEESHKPLALLINTESLYHQMAHQQMSNNLRIFPIAFSPRVCSFQSSSMPLSYINAISEIFQNIRTDNLNLSDDGLKISTFQGYSSIKQHAYPVDGKFPLGQSIYTAAYALPISHIPDRYRSKYQQLQQSAKNHQPFTEFIDAIHHARDEEHINARFEPVITIYINQLDFNNQTLEYLAEKIILPLLYLWDTKNGLNICKSLLSGFDYVVRFFYDQFELIK
jgi:hypothetical protein